MMRAAAIFVATISFVRLTEAPAQGQVYEFTGDYCAACRAVEPLVKQLVSRGYPIQQIDVQSRPELARKFQIQQIPCFLAIRDGQVVGRVVGAADGDELVQLCELTRGPDPSEPPVVRGQTPRPRGRLIDRLRRGPTATCRCKPGSCKCRAACVPCAGNADPYQRARSATVRLRIEDDSGHSFGTGTIVDVHDDEALVLTCGHIFRSSEGKGRVMCELFCPNAPPAVEGKLICYDMRRDVGLISVSPGVAVTAVAVGGTGQRPKTGDSVFSVGCNRGDDPSVIKNKVLAVNRYHGPANLVVGGRPVDGRSGGGLFDDNGVLIGVCNAADQEKDEGLYAALGPIHAELDRAGLGFIYRPQQPALAVRPNAEAPAAGDTIKTPTAAMPNTLAPRPASSSRPAELPGQPRAIPVHDEPVIDALPQTPFSQDSVRRTAGMDSELICVVRDAHDRDGGNRVFVIDRPSTELVRQLSQEANQRGPLSPTQMHHPRRLAGGLQKSDATNGWRSGSDR